MIGRPQFAQARQLAHCQQLDARILDQGDKCDLQWFQSPDGKSWAAKHDVRLGVRCRRSVQRVCRFALHAAIDLGQSDQWPCDSRTALWRLDGVAAKTSQQRRLPHNEMTNALVWRSVSAKPMPADARSISRAREFILQGEECQPSATVAGRHLQAGRDKILEGMDVARRQDLPHPRCCRLDRFAGPQREVVHGAPPARQRRTDSPVSGGQH